MAAKQKGAKLQLRYTWSEEALVQHLWDENGRVQMSVLDILSEVAPHGFESDLICDLLDLIVDLQAIGASRLEIARQLLHQVRPASEDDVDLHGESSPQPVAYNAEFLSIRVTEDTSDEQGCAENVPTNSRSFSLESVAASHAYPLPVRPGSISPPTSLRRSWGLGFEPSSPWKVDISEFPTVLGNQEASSYMVFVNHWNWWLTDAEGNSRCFMNMAPLLSRLFEQTATTTSSAPVHGMIQLTPGRRLETHVGRMYQPMALCSRIVNWPVNAIDVYLPDSGALQANPIDPNQLHLWSE